MFKKPVVVDEGLRLIADYEAAIIKACDERVTFGIPAVEVQQQRPAVVALAAAVCGQLRAEYLSRRSGG